MKLHIYLLIVSMLYIIFVFPVSAFAKSLHNDELQIKYSDGIEALRASEYLKAYELFVEVLSASPDSINALFYAAISAQEMGRYNEAIELYSKLITLQPNDWEAMQRLIVLLNSQKKSKVRDKYRTMLNALWKSRSVPELSKRPIYVLDKFETKQALVYVFNSFEMKGKTPVLYKFNVYRSEKKSIENGPTEVISVGSYEFTTKISRELGEISETDRIYHLDGYLPDGSHMTYNFYLNEPPYDEVKIDVLKILSGKKKPISGFKPGPKGKTINVPKS